MNQCIMVGTKEGLRELGGESEAPLIADHEVTALARSGSEWMAIVDGAEAWRFDDGGEWSEVAELDGFRANCILPTDSSGAFIGTSEAHLFELRDGSLLRLGSFDQAPDRERWFTPWGGPPDVPSLTATPSGAVYANVHVGGVLRSPDGGASWQPTLDIDADVHQVLFDHESGVPAVHGRAA